MSRIHKKSKYELAIALVGFLVLSVLITACDRESKSGNSTERMIDELQNCGNASSDTVVEVPGIPGGSMFYSQLITKVGESGDQAAVQPLIACLESPDEFTRMYAAEALGKLRNPDAVMPLVKHLEDKDENGSESLTVRGSVLEALREIRDPRAIPPLVALVGKKEGPLTIEDEPTYMPSWELRSTIAAFGDSAIPEINNQDPQVIASTYSFYIRLGIHGLEPSLINALNEYGDGYMATDYLNCGNDQLKNAALEWAKAHDYRVTGSKIGSGPKWGQE